MDVPELPRITYTVRTISVATSTTVAAGALVVGAAYAAITKTADAYVANQNDKVTLSAIESRVSTENAEKLKQTNPLIGDNPQVKKGRTNTDLPGGQEAAKKKFDELTKGQKVKTDPSTGHDVSEDGTRLRLNPDGTARIDVPNSGTQPNGETVHFKDPDQVAEEKTATCHPVCGDGTSVTDPSNAPPQNPK